VSLGLFGAGAGVAAVLADFLLVGVAVSFDELAVSEPDVSELFELPEVEPARIPSGLGSGVSNGSSGLLFFEEELLFEEELPEVVFPPLAGTTSRSESPLFRLLSVRVVLVLLTRRGRLEPLLCATTGNETRRPTPVSAMVRRILDFIINVFRIAEEMPGF
jgi:hypothetical protein